MFVFANVGVVAREILFRGFGPIVGPSQRISQLTVFGVVGLFVHSNERPGCSVLGGVVIGSQYLRVFKDVFCFDILRY